MEDRLPPGRAAGLGHDRRDRVDELGEAGDPDAVGVVEQRDAGAAERERVGHRVDLLEDRRRDRPRPRERRRPAARPIPDVPLVDAERDPPPGSGAQAGGVGDRRDFVDEAVDQVGARQQRRQVACEVVQVDVQRDVVDVLERVREDGLLPGAEGRHVAARRAADRELERRIEQLHHLGRLRGDAAVLVGRLGFHLPRAVHLVAEAPEAHRVRRRPAVRDAQVGELAAARMVAVLEQPPCGVAAAGAEVDREHRLDAGDATPVDELVGAEVVRLSRQPREVEPARPPLARADAVLPLVAGDEVAARVADERRPQLADEREDVATEAVGVGARMAGLVETAVDAAPDVLDERAEQAPVGLADHRAAPDRDRNPVHPCAAPRQCRPRRRPTRIVHSARSRRCCKKIFPPPA
jgi:hypothetical protein